MKNNDVELILRILTDDEAAFAELVNKYQKQVHALAWRKIGDFHIAEEITQDTFLKVYQRLHTLKDPSLFSGWLYVITANLCASWRRKKLIQTQPLENIEDTMSEVDAYSKHVAEERTKTAIETQREVVKKLLEKLKESERTVMTLHYLGEMTVEEISKFIGVPAGTIKSRLQRARNRLQKEETMIREALEHFQISPNMTDNIMQEVARLKPTPSGSKPFIPWGVATSTTILIALIFGIGNQHLARFQNPYSLDAQSEMSVEITEAPIKHDIMVVPKVRNQNRSTNAIGKSDPQRQNPDDVLLAVAETDDEDVSISKKNNMDLEMILAGIKSNDELVKSGEVKVIFMSQVTVVPPGDEEHLDIRDSTIIFNSDRIRLDSLSEQDSLSRTTILLPNSTWRIQNPLNTNKMPIYDFHTQQHKYQFPVVDPRNWYSVNKNHDLPTYLRNENFHIQRIETLNDNQFNNIICYVLEKKYAEISEDKQTDTFTRIWISPERGFRYVKFEAQEPNKRDGTLVNTRITISHQNFGEIWFPNRCDLHTTQIDNVGNKHTFQQTIVTRDFKLNHPVPPETFTVDIPDNAIIRVNNRELSKTEFLKGYKKDNNPRQNPDEVLLTGTEIEGENTSTIKQQWVQGNAPEYNYGSSVRSVYPAPEGDTYFFSNDGLIAKLPANGTEWEYVSDVSTLHDYRNWNDEIPITTLNDTLYIILSHELFSSTDKGKTWQSAGKCPQGDILDLVVIDNVFYLAMRHQIFRSTDIGKTWVEMGDDLLAEISAIKAIQNTLFVSTSIDRAHALYRLNGDNWERLQFPHAEIHDITSFSGTNILYVMASLDVMEIDGRNHRWGIFRSVDKGDSWTDVTPKNAWDINDDPPSVTLTAAGKIVLVIGINDGAVVRSIDEGNTWILKEVTGIPIKSLCVTHAVALDESIFFSLGNSGFLRSLDGGLSWNRVKISDESRIDDLIWIKPDEKQESSGDLYCMVVNEVFKSSNAGKSWQVVNPKINIREYNTDEPPVFNRISRSSDILYAKHGGYTFSNIKTGIYRISEDRDTFVPIQGMPTFDSQDLRFLMSGKLNDKLDLSDKTFEETLKEKSVGADQFFKTLGNWDIDEQNGITKRELYQEYIELISQGVRGMFAVSGNTFYMEYNYKLFRWKPGESEWYDTGVEETGELNRRKLVESLELEGLPQEKIYDIITASTGFKLAASGNTIYVGKRDGKLVASFDEGNNWIDFTPVLPFPVTYFKEIVFAGTTVYVATDAGVAATDNGKNWYPLSDTSGTHVNIDKLTVDGNTLYGYSKKTGLYRLVNGIWEQISSDTPSHVNSLAAYGDTLYVGTMEQGMFLYKLE